MLVVKVLGARPNQPQGGHLKVSGARPHFLSAAGALSGLAAGKALKHVLDGILEQVGVVGEGG